MEQTSERKTKIFKGAGYITGFLIGTAIAIVFVALTGIEALIGAVAAAFALPVGMALEKKFQAKKTEKETKEHNLLFVFITVGVILLVVVFLFNLQR
jgi:hypothetical protein